MIAYLNGTIRKKLTKTVIVDTGNIGYLVNIATPLFDKIEEKQALELFIYTRVREDDISLYGFETLSELDFFKMLINVNGIGAKTAMEILSQNIDKVKSALISGDTAWLCKTPGIGKKTAERMILELKNKVTLDDISRLHTGLETKVNDDAISALMTLGYQKFEILKVIREMPENIKKEEEIITYFLRNI